MKKLLVILAAVSMLTLTVSCSKKNEAGATEKSASAVAETFTKFSSDDFTGDWVLGTWDFSAEQSENGKGEKVAGTVVITSETDDKGVTLKAAGEKDDTMSLKDFRIDILREVEKNMPSEKELESAVAAGMKVTGKPYIEINNTKTKIVLDFNAEMEGESMIVKMTMAKQAQQAK